jgi:hypothetical protein
MANTSYLRKNHKRRLERAELVAAAFRQYVGMPYFRPAAHHQAVLDELMRRLQSWMRVAPKDIMYKTAVKGIEP